MHKNLPIIFLPGLLCDAALWRAPVARLIRQAPCMVPDLTGHDNMPSLAQHVLDLAPLQFSLVALSMGGYVAFEILRQAPERVKKLALFNTSARPDSDEQLQRRGGLIKLAQQGKFKGVTPRLLPMLVNAKNQKNPNVTRVIMAMAQRVGQQAFERQQRAIMGRVDSRPLLSSITCSAMVVGGVDDQLTPPDVVQEIAQGIAGSALHVLDDCGHLAPLEQPDKVTALLEGFLLS